MILARSEKQVIKKEIVQVYDQFLDKVAEGRKMKCIELERISFSISVRIRADCPEFTEAAVMPVRLCSVVLG
jgi:hypothetical protein